MRIVGHDIESRKECLYRLALILKRHRTEGIRKGSGAELRIEIILSLS
jgi:hypothetical protein